MFQVLVESNKDQELIRRLAYCTTTAIIWLSFFISVTIRNFLHSLHQHTNHGIFQYCYSWKWKWS
ncbi:MAG: hypothetical protein AB1489_43530, partial [Acidobacteriota bacterium]